MFSKSSISRLKVFFLFFFFTILVIFFVYKNIKKNSVYFYSPKQVQNLNNMPSAPVRIGGLVKQGSIKKNNGIYNFIITDLNNDIFVEYKGLLPDLFIEGKSAVVEGYLKDKKSFIARTVLAKHDQNYMPPEIAKMLKVKTENNK
jgi:cytochrome c-type biogenesis protein CcmE